MKKLFLLITVIVMLLSLCACGDVAEVVGEIKPTTQKELYKMGLDIVATMREMVESEEYREIIGAKSLGDVKDVVVTDDYDKPKAVYSIDEPDTEEILALSLGNSDNELWDSLSDNLQNQLETRINFSSTVSAINSSKGTNNIAVSSLYMAQTELDTLNIDDTEIFLYTFEKGTPVVVIFNELGYATGQFAFVDDVKEFEKFKCEIKEIK